MGGPGQENVSRPIAERHFFGQPSPQRAQPFSSGPRRGKMAWQWRSTWGKLTMHPGIKVLALVCALAAGCVTAQALEVGKLDAVTKAADAFAQLAKNSHQTGRPPRQSDAAAKVLLDTVLDTSDIQRGQPMPWSELRTLNGWSTATIKIGLVYYLAGTGADSLAALYRDAYAMDKANRNTATFAPEFGRYSDAHLLLQAAIVDTMQDFLSTLPAAEREQPALEAAFGKAGNGVAQSITGLLGTFVVEGISDDWRLARLTVATGIAPKTAKFLRPEDLQKVHDTALEVADHVTNAQVKDRLVILAETFAPPP
jgi:hypothetical protein